MNDMERVLIGSSVRQDPRVLEYFLDSLRDLKARNFAVDYMFVDDNDDARSSLLLLNFRPLRSSVVIVPCPEDREPYVRDEIHHHWNEKLVWRVARNKNLILDYGRKHRYDYVLLVDADLVLHPETLARLVATGKDIVAEIFWTRWRPGTEEGPQVWLRDHYTTYRCGREEKLTEEEKMRRVREFLDMLRRPGVYRVGGLGACTLFTLKALRKGVSFDEIYNLSFVGEDRHLCIRAAALGFELFVDTHFPAYHIYRESDLEGVPAYLASFRKMGVEACRQLITSTLRGVLEELESADFRRRMDARRYRNNFTARGWAALRRRRARRGVLRKKKILRAEVVSTKLAFDDGLDRCRVVAELNVKGSERGGRVEKKLRVRLDTINAGEWLIDHYEAEEGGLPTPSPVIAFNHNGFTRVIRPGPQKITLAMLVRNEAGRYLPMVLAHAARYVDEAVILDDASTDNTVEVCRAVLKDIPLFIYSNPSPGFDNEVGLRKQLWELVARTAPEWILSLDADEMFEDRVVSVIRHLVNQPHVDVYGFRIFDFWDMDHYREDDLWNAHLRYSPLLVRYQPDFPYVWREKPLHCGRLPQNITLLPTALSDLRVKHYGWAREEDRLQKYERYMRADPAGRYGSLAQYRSILDPAPNLKRWRENENA